MPYSYRLSIDEYRRQCLEFFREQALNEESIEALIVHMDKATFEAWHEKTALAYYNALYPVVRDVGVVVRDGWYASRIPKQDDPLRTPEGQAFYMQYHRVLNEVLTQTLEMLPCIVAKRSSSERGVGTGRVGGHLHVDGHAYKPLDGCEILENKSSVALRAWVVAGQFGNMLVVGDNGVVHHAERTFLENKIKEYKQTIARMEALLALLPEPAVLTLQKKIDHS